MFSSFCAIFHDDFKYINGKSSRQETYVPLSANKTSRNGYKPLLFKADSPLLMIHGSYQESPTRQLNEKYRASYRLQKSSTDYHHSPIPCGDSRRLKTTLNLNDFYKRVYLIYS